MVATCLLSFFAAIAAATLAGSVSSPAPSTISTPVYLSANLFLHCFKTSLCVMILTTPFRRECYRLISYGYGALTLRALP
jgi:hypothetical protein